MSDINPDSRNMIQKGLGNLFQAYLENTQEQEEHKREMELINAKTRLVSAQSAQNTPTGFTLPDNWFVWAGVIIAVVVVGKKMF